MNKTMKKQNRFCIIIPAYNEATVVSYVIKSTHEALKKAGLNFEIVVINDFSKDNTSIVASSSGAKVIDHIINTGSGGATSTGLRYSLMHDFDFAATIDADGQHHPDDLVKGIKLIMCGDTDLLIGSRLLDSTGMSKTKIIGNKGLSFITYCLFGINVTDSQSGLRIFSKKALNSLEWKTTGYEFCSEMIWRAKQQNLRIKEFPIRAIYTDYSKRKGQNNWNAFNIIKSLVRRRIMELFSE